MIDVDAEFFVLRTPLLAFEALLAWAEDAEAPAALRADGHDELLEQALRRDRETLRRRLSETLADPQVEQALELGSDDLHAGIRHWRGDPESARGRSAEHSLTRYFTRMTTRPALFGLFAGYVIGEIGGLPALALASRDEMRARARLDPDVLAAVVRHVAAAAHGDDDLRLRRNPLLYRGAGRLRVPVRGANTARRIVALRPTPAIEAVLRAATAGASARALAAVVQDLGVGAGAARALVWKLVDREALVPVAELPTTGGDATDTAIALLRDVPGGQPAAEAVGLAARALDGAEGRPVDGFGAAAAHLRSVWPGVPARPVHVDAIRPGVARLPNAVIHEMHRAIGLLQRVAPGHPAPVLETFRRDFELRYGDRAVPLMKALDPDCGIALRDEDVPPDDVASARYAARMEVLFDLVARHAGSQSAEVQLTDADVEALADPAPAALPDAFTFKASLVATDARALAAGDFMLLRPTTAGPSGARHLGRLCDGDADLASRVVAHLRQEEALQPDAVFAEVTSRPDTGVGLSITHRPLLRSMEIECLGSSGAPPERRIALDDLLVAVRDGRIVLWSRSLDRRVVVRGTTAMNPRWIALPAARFLALLENPDQRSALAWDWGAASRTPSLPRIRRGRIVLAPRCWNVSLAALRDRGAPLDGARLRALQAWRDIHGLPRVVTVDSGTRSLAVDFHNVLSVEAFLAATGAAERVRLVEMPGASPVSGPDGTYAHEILVPFVRTRAAATPRQAPHGGRPTRAAAQARRRFAPGSEWLYAKLYASYAMSDGVLLDVVAPLRRALRERGLVDRWFFMRYADPDPHLRVRFHGRPRDLTAHVIGALHDAVAPALTDGRLHRVTLDTYEREVERYGGLEGVELMERAFEADSDAALEILAATSPRIERRHLAVAGLAALYEDADLTLQARLDCCTELCDRMRSADVSTRSLAAQERAERAAVLRVLAWLGDAQAPAAIGALASRSVLLRPVLDELRALDRAQRLQRPLADVVTALAHMHVNRVMRTSGRHDEVRVHDALARVYAGSLARARVASAQAQDA